MVAALIDVRFPVEEIDKNKLFGGACAERRSAGEGAETFGSVDAKKCGVGDLPICNGSHRDNDSVDATGNPRNPALLAEQ
jgi:hypothetical protein